MKGKTLLVGAVIGILVTVFSSCKADVDLTQLDGTVGADMALALPVGELSATIGDFIGNGAVSEYIQVDEDGVLFFRDTFNIARSFYKIDLRKYISNANQRFDVGSQVGGRVIPRGIPVELRFPITLELSNINTVFDQERIDSIWIRDALFTSNFTLVNLPLTSADIQKLEIELDDNFTFASGASRRVNVPLPAPNCLGVDIPINVEEFYLNLMKDRKEDPANSNTINKVQMDFIFTIVPTDNVSIPTNAQIDYNLLINFLEYHAIWGWFNPSNQMRDEDTLCIADEWDGWNDIKQLVVPFAEPQVEMNVYNSIGAPLILDGRYIFTKSVEPDTEPVYATFDGDNNLIWPMPYYVGLKDDFTKVVKNTYVFSEDPGKGHLDNLFKTRPDSIGYAYSLYPNNSKAQADGVKHYRLTEYTDIDLEAIVTLPFTFNEGTAIAYSDTVDSIYIEGYQIDSLIAEIEAIKEVEVNSLKLILNASNYIPFDVDVELLFLDSLAQEIDFDLGEEGNKIHIAGPTEVENGVITEPGQSTLIIEINQDKYDELTRLRKLVFTASLGGNTTYVRLLDESGLKLQIAVAADVSALADLDVLFNGETEEVAQ